LNNFPEADSRRAVVLGIASFGGVFGLNKKVFFSSNLCSHLLCATTPAADVIPRYKTPYEIPQNASKLVRIAICLLLISVFFLLCSPTFAVDLQELLESALANDTRLKVLNTELDNTLLAIERARLAPGRNLELSTGDIQAAYSFRPSPDDPNLLISFSPSAALVLGRERETEFSAELPTAIGVDTGEFTVLPEVAIRQPLDKLFNGEKFTETQELENRYAAEKARIDILKRVKTVEQDLLQQLSELTSLEQQFVELKRKLAAAENAWQQAAELQTYTAGSAQEKELEFNVRQAQRQAELQQKRIDLARVELERIVGKALQDLPEGYPELDLQVPNSTAVAKNPDVFLASLAVDVEQARLEEEKEPAKPKFYLGSALRSELDEVTEEKTTRLAATLDGEFEDFAFTTGVGGIYETRSLFVTVGFSWSFPDKKIESMNLKERENLLDISRWNLTGARKIFLKSAELLSLEAEELSYRKINLEEETALAELQLEEGLGSHRAGLITDQELEDLKWEVDKLGYAARILQLDRLLLASRIDTLTGLETEAQ
jgi:hypothetical protein